MIDKLHKECVWVNSWHFSVLIDLPRCRMFRYPKTGNESIKRELDYANLLKNEFVIPKNVNSTPFQDIDTTYSIPNLLTTLVWEYSQSAVERIISLTKELNIQFIVILFKDGIIKSDLENVLRGFEHTPLRSIDLIFLSQNIHTIDYFKQLNKINSRVVLIMSESDESKYDFVDDKKGIVAFGKLDLKANTTYFNIHVKQYVESFSHNPYFNNRLFISETGDIKLDINSQNVLARISDIIDLKTWIEENDYLKAIWDSSKEKTDVCSDCEYRNICLDNRIPIQRIDGSYFHLTECNYNPYIAKWKGEEGYMPLKDCGVITNEKEFVIDLDKLESVNKQF